MEVRQAEEKLVEPEAETGAVWPQAQGRGGPPKAGRGGEAPPPGPLERARPSRAAMRHLWTPGR